MSRGLVVYFSLGGTTARVAGSIGVGLRAAGYQVDLCNLRDAQPPPLGGYDLLGVGSPVYYYRPPFNVMDYVNSLPSLEGLPTFVFVLHGTYRGDTGKILRQALERKGTREVGYLHCHGADFYLRYLEEGYLFSPDHPTAEELARAEAFGRHVSAAVAGTEAIQREEDPPLGIIYRLERFVLNRWLVEEVYSRLFRVDKAKCTACGLCIEQCPTGNIAGDKDGRPVWGRRCLLCLNCEVKCPKEAITSPDGWPLFRPAFKYNVLRASRDPSIDHVRVKHSQGRTQRL